MAGFVQRFLEGGQFLRPEQAELAFRKMWAELGGKGEVPPEVEEALSRIANLAPGNFAAVRRSFGSGVQPSSAGALLADLESEARLKERAPRRVGF